MLEYYMSYHLVIVLASNNLYFFRIFVDFAVIVLYFWGNDDKINFKKKAAKSVI